MFEAFGWQHFPLIFEGLLVTVQICLLSTVIGTALGFALGLMSTGGPWWARLVSATFVTIVRGIPVLLIIFFVFFGIPLLFPGQYLPEYWAAVLALSIFAAAYIGEIVRGSILAVPRGQTEAADALGMSARRRYQHIVLPQAAKIMVPPGVGFLVVLIKDSSLVAVIGLVELTRAGNVVSSLTADPILIYLIVGAFYFVICYLFSSLGRALERRLNVQSPKVQITDALTLKLGDTR
ncbi:amino acid ABC transporter permease [Arthrobacter sp. M2012083]|uniref:amino acid ABC transporter permease n=1 Tax=Arthrobacter sp. M2012083 TaxID=1197706 RepID=UPI0002E4BEEF|nr:amino acid ABC transporter permease [Arthrobacter sp. M2012083]